MQLIKSILEQFSHTDLLHIRALTTNILTGRLPHSEQSRLFWDHKGYTQNLNTATVNPSKDDLNIYKKYLTNENNSKNALLLGSTPMLRNLLSEAGFQNYVVTDFSFKTIESSSRALDKLNIGIDIDNEIWLKSDWLEIPLEPESFDYIVGDMVFTQIEPGKQSLFVEKLASLLKPEGHFVGRMHICNTNFDDMDPKTIITEVLRSKDFQNTTEQRLGLLYKLRDRLRNKENHITSIHTITSELLQFKTADEKGGDFLRTIVGTISRRADIGLSFITQTKEELEKIILRKFIIEKIVTATDYYSEYFPIYVLRKK